MPCGFLNPDELPADLSRLDFDLDPEVEEELREMDEADPW